MRSDEVKETKRPGNLGWVRSVSGGNLRMAPGFRAARWEPQDDCADRCLLKIIKVRLLAVL